MIGALLAPAIVTSTSLLPAQISAPEPKPIFDAASQTRGHVHASSLVECPNGDLIAVWYENNPEAVAEGITEPKDRSSDVRISGSRLRKGEAEWGPSFVAADVFGLPSNNPSLVIDSQQSLWLFYPTLIGAPEEPWGTALLQYAISTNYLTEGSPRWDSHSQLVPKVDNLGRHVEADLRARAEAQAWSSSKLEEELAILQQKQGDVLKSRLGWMPRSHPILRSDGALVVPIANENYFVSCMAITQDGGKSWQISNPVPAARILQPTIAEVAPGQLVAFFRNSWEGKKIVRSESLDGGMTWTPAQQTELRHPCSGIEVLQLASGRLLIAFNDSESGRDKLALSLSEDQGKTWQHTRYIENDSEHRYDYPSLVQASNGRIHLTYSYDTKTIRHASFDEQWLLHNDLY